MENIKNTLKKFNFKFYVWRLFFDVLGRILQIFEKKYLFLRSLRFSEKENFAVLNQVAYAAKFLFKKIIENKEMNII